MRGSTSAARRAPDPTSAAAQSSPDPASPDATSATAHDSADPNPTSPVALSDTDVDDYDASAITVLEGIEAVRKRPGMYIGGTGVDGLHHLLWEIVDNACDEAMAGHASTIRVILHKDGESVTVEDNGRGIPVDMHPTQGRSALEVIFTTLHAGGKFGGGSYGAAGGLHGVGASAVNALSSQLVARIKRKGKLWVQEFRRGRPRGAVEAVDTARGTGTSITFTPDPEMFDELGFDPDRILAHLEVKSFLHRGVRILFVDQYGDASHELVHAGGLVDFLQVLESRAGVARVVGPTFSLQRESNGVGIELAMGWTDAVRERIQSYVNGIPPPTAAPTSKVCATRSAKRCVGSSTPTNFSRAGSPSPRKTFAKACSACFRCGSWSRNSKGRPRADSTTPKCAVRSILRFGPRFSNGCTRTNRSVKPSSPELSKPRAPGLPAARRPSRCGVSRRLRDG